MKKRFLLLASLLCLTMLLNGCGGSKTANGSALQDNVAPSLPEYSQSDGAWDTGGVTGSGGIVNGDSDIYRDPNTKVIRSAELSIQTTEFDKSAEALSELTRELGGYYETARVDGGGLYDKNALRSGCYVVRIPRENFEAFRDGAGGIGHLYSITEDAQDVGEQYYDTEARLATLTTKRDRLLALLEKADVMEDIISLENALADVQYEIDMHTSTLRRYDSLIGYSTFTISLNEVVQITTEPGVKESFGSRLAASFRRGMQDFGEGLQNFLLWLARNIIGVLILSVIVVVIIVVLRKVTKQRRFRNKKPE